MSNNVVEALRAAAETLSPHVVSAKLPPTVNTFLHILIAHLTQYDMRLSLKKHEQNIYRLAHYLGTFTKVAKDMNGKLESQSKEDLEALKESMARRFRNLPPVDKTVKALDLFMSNGTLPRYPIPKQKVG